METEQLIDGRQVRQRRRLGRPTREKTPDPNIVNGRRRQTTDESEEMVQDEPAQVVRMQIRPPGHTMSAHESKILRRRDKTFASAAARSHSQPREAEKISSPEAFDLIKSAVKHRSLSTPRHKDESSESELTSGRSTGNASFGYRATADENLSRLEQNLQRFEIERKRFEAEKRLFEREKREHKARHRQMLDNEERKRLLQNYRKLSDRIQLPTDEEERRRLVHSLRLQRHEVPAVRMRNRSSGYDESSTQFSSSDADTPEDVVRKMQPPTLSPVRRHASSASSSYVASVRGAPPLPPGAAPKPPERHSVSRNSSLSPIRPERRSKTPEQRVEAMRKYTEIGELGTGQPRQPKITEEQQRKELMRKYTEAAEHAAELLAAAQAQGIIENEAENLRRLRSLRYETTPKVEPEVKRSSSLERPLKTKRNVSLERKPIEVFKKEASPTMPVEDETQPLIQISEKLAEEDTVIAVTSTPKTGFFHKLIKYFTTEKISKLVAKPTSLDTSKETDIAILSKPLPDKMLSGAFIQRVRLEAHVEWRQLKLDYPNEVVQLRRMRNICIAHTLMLTMLCGFGGLMFRYTEGTSEDIYKCEVRKVKRDFIDNLWTVSHSMREDDWKSLARTKLRKFEEELSTLAELGMRRIPGQRSWNFVNCIIYCWTVISTIGYGHITPKTTFGRSLTIVYAIIGIPMFLIMLADFGKLFTRGMKFVWAYVRRLYYTGTCRQIRKQQQVRDAISGFNTAYDMAFRRPSMFFGIGGETDAESQSDVPKSLSASHPETPTSPYPETFEVDDEFNLPVSVASLLLIGYILFGALLYHLTDKWSFFDAFYFVFVSMSTIGFGDMVPNDPIFMMCSIIYLVFGLALTSMFINVVQIKLSETFKQASAKIGATIGLGLASETGDEEGSQVKTPSELASIHGSRLDKIAENELDPNGSANQYQPPSILRPPRPISPSSMLDQQNGSQLGEVGSSTAPPVLPPKRQVSVEQPPPAEGEKKKKKRGFFR